MANQRRCSRDVVQPFPFSIDRELDWFQIRHALHLPYLIPLYREPMQFFVVGRIINRIINFALYRRSYLLSVKRDTAGNLAYA
jgi:hypothetical protein